MFFVPLVLSLLILTGCRIVFDPTAQKEEQIETQKDHRKVVKVQEQEEVGEAPKGERKITLGGRAELEGNSIVVTGQTNLPAGAVVRYELKQYYPDADLEEFEQYKAEPKAKEIERDAREIGTGGTARAAVFELPEPDQRYRLDMYYIPYDASPEIQELLLDDEESIDELEGIKTIEYQEAAVWDGRSEIKGYIAHINILPNEGTEKVTLEFEQM
ncbi:hypothetical protein [Bacillus salacetis]|nr:hypothetical protein [Bacillus salacetis]